MGTWLPLVVASGVWDDDTLGQSALYRDIKLVFTASMVMPLDIARHSKGKRKVARAQIPASCIDSAAQRLFSSTRARRVADASRSGREG